MKNIAIAIFVLFIGSSLNAQYGAGTLKLSLALGNSPYVGLLQSPTQTSSTQYLSVEGARWISGSNNSLVNMVGMEFKFFVADELSVKFIGGGQTSYTPGQNEIPGVDDDVYPFDPQTALPKFSDIKEQSYHQYLAQIGVDKYIVRGKAAIYFGAEGGFRYGGSSSKSITENSAGTSIAQVYGFHGAITCGAEYGTESGLFAGVEIRPASFAYTACTIEPIPGAFQNAENSTFGFFVYPMLRFGVNF